MRDKMNHRRKCKTPKKQYEELNVSDFNDILKYKVYKNDRTLADKEYHEKKHREKRKDSHKKKQRDGQGKSHKGKPKQTKQNKTKRD